MSEATFVYDYLKENPQERDALLKNNWQSALKGMSDTAQREFLELQKMGININDAVLFWSMLYITALIIGNKVHDVFPTRPEYVKLYNLFYNAYVADGVVRDLRLISEMLFVVNTSPNEISNIAYFIDDIDTALLFYKHLYGRPYSLHTSISHAIVISVLYPVTVTRPFYHSTAVGLDYFTKRLLREVYSNALNSFDIDDLLRDVPFPINGKRYDSFNEIEKAHDKATEIKVAEQLAKIDKEKRFIYDQRLVEIVRKYNYDLPKNREWFIKRGVQHSNCVGTYVSRHMSTVVYSEIDCRKPMLIYNDSTTCELLIMSAYGKTYAVVPDQYKGRFNKDVKKPEGLFKLCAELTGLEIDIINVKEV